MTSWFRVWGGILLVYGVVCVWVASVGGAAVGGALAAGLAIGYWAGRVLSRAP